MQKIFEKLIKDIMNVIGTIVKNTWVPILITSMEVLMITSILWALFSFTPHNLDFLKTLDFISIVVIVVSVRLLKYTSNATDDIEDNESNQPKQDHNGWIEVDEEDLMLPVIKSHSLPEEPPPPKSVPNVKQSVYPFIQDPTEDEDFSTRE